MSTLPMQAIMETGFDAIYLITVVTLGVRMLARAKGERQFQLFGAMAVLLGCGDAFHLVPRAWALWTSGLDAHAAALGFGKFVTSLTMTVFYLLLYHVWRARYAVVGRGGLTVLVHLLAAARIGLCLLPQNDWLSATPPLAWGIYRNLPFALLGLVIVVLFFRVATARGDRPFRFLWLAVLLSFGFYVPVVLFSGAYPLVGVLMIPKTCAYLWMVWMGWRALKDC